MELPRYKGFTEEQCKQFGPAKEKNDVIETERHVYCVPFIKALRTLEPVLRVIRLIMPSG